MEVRCEAWYRQGRRPEHLYQGPTEEITDTLREFMESRENMYNLLAQTRGKMWALFRKKGEGLPFPTFDELCDSFNSDNRRMIELERVSV